LIYGSDASDSKRVLEPEVWIPAAVAGGDCQLIGLDELADMDVIHGQRRTCPGTYEAWRAVLRPVRPLC
jgi:hypothetical protein